MVYTPPRICSGKWDAQTPQGFWDKNWPPNLSQTTRPCNNQQKKENLLNCGLGCLGWPQSKRKISMWTLLGKWKNWNMKVTVIPLEIGALGTVTKGLVQGVEENKRTSGVYSNYSIIEIDQNTEKSWGDLLSLRLQWETIG